MSVATLDTAYRLALESFSLTDIEELQRIIPQVKSTKLKQLIERDIALARSKIVTKLVNENLAKKNGAGKKKETRTVLEEVEVEIEDEDGYIEKHIKGYKEKARSIKNTLPDTSTSKIRDALIRCKGDEGNAVDGLLSGTLPPRPKIDKKKVKQTVQKKMVVFVDTTDGSTSSADAQQVPDITIEQNNNSETLNKRISILKTQIDEEKETTQKLLRNSKSKKDVSVLQDLMEDDGSKQNKMYLPGEYDAIERDECRIFTFKPERTFSNEVSHIHFRVAESEFHRLLQTKNSYRVTEVKYIVTPYLTRKFEQQRAQIAHARGKKFRDEKPILAFHGMHESEIEWVTLNNIRNVDQGVLFTSEPADATRYFDTKGGSLMLFLLLPGATKSVNNLGTQKWSSYARQGGFDSLVNNNGTEHVVFNPDLILPYYIVKYEPATPQQYNYQQQQGTIKRLDEEWNNIESEAKADKFMDDCKKFYQQTLVHKDSEHKMGAIDPTQQWFNVAYAKKYEEEKKFAGEATPLSANSVEFEFDYGSGSEDVPSEMIDDEEIVEIDDDVDDE